MKSLAAEGKNNMGGIKQALFTMVVIGSVAFAGAAMAAGKGGGVGSTMAPGQLGSSPGQVFNTPRASNPNTLSPGQQFNVDRARTPTTPPPGQTFTNFGRSKK
jgi:hypothetical protein